MPLTRLATHNTYDDDALRYANSPSDAQRHESGVGCKVLRAKGLGLPVFRHPSGGELPTLRLPHSVMHDAARL